VGAYGERVWQNKESKDMKTDLNGFHS